MHAQCTRTAHLLEFTVILIFRNMSGEERRRETNKNKKRRNFVYCILERTLNTHSVYCTVVWFICACSDYVAYIKRTLRVYACVPYTDVYNKKCPMSTMLVNYTGSLTRSLCVLYGCVVYCSSVHVACVRLFIVLCVRVRLCIASNKCKLCLQIAQWKSTKCEETRLNLKWKSRLPLICKKWFLWVYFHLVCYSSKGF